jgi:glycosyltransferase involved in cell wall biosynthesis
VKKLISIVLTVHNKGWLLQRVLESIQDYKSDLTKEIVIVLDGCTDNSYKVVKAFDFNIPITVVETPDIWETKANNVGIKKTHYPYNLLIQDDMVMCERDFDRRLLKPFLVWNNVLAVTARDTSDDDITKTGVGFYNFSGNSRNIFYVRDVAIRGPLMLDYMKTSSLGFFDEDFAPLTFDDHDLCIKGYLQHEWISGSYPTAFESKLEWGTTRQPEKREHHSRVYTRNESRVVDKYLGRVKHHSEERELL